MRQASSHEGERLGTSRAYLRDDDLRTVMTHIEGHLARIADHFDPSPPDKVGTPYVAERLDCTADWVAVMVRDGEIPSSCVVPGTGHGKPWKFYRSRIDEWIEKR